MIAGHRPPTTDRRAPVAAMGGYDKRLLESVARRRWALLMYATVIALALVLALVNLPYAPQTWFDEGSHLHVPKTLIQHGVYADISSEGFRYYGPTVGVGPTVMLPVALVFKLFGVGLLQGRLVISLYLLVALAAGYTLTRRLHGPSVGLLALLLLLGSRTLGHEGLVEYGRMVLGEAPGMAFLFLGALCWLMALRADHRPPTTDDGTSRAAISRRSSVVSGLLFGLALVTKNQFALIVPPALALLALLDWRYYRAGSWWLRLAPPAIACACFGAWMLVQALFLGPGTLAENIQMTRQAAGGAIFVFDREASERSLKYLLRPDLYGGLLLPALVYAAWRARRRDAQGLAEAFVVVMAGLWLAWFAGASLGWARYAFPAVAFGAPAVARLLVDLYTWLRGNRLRLALRVVLVGYTAVLLALPIGTSLRSTLAPDSSAQRFAAYLDAHVPRQAIVETWEPELGVLTDHRYHYPPIQLLDKAVRHEWLGGPITPYNWQASAPPYLVIGPFGGYTGIYYNNGGLNNYQLVEQIGPYALFARK